MSFFLYIYSNCNMSWSALAGASKSEYIVRENKSSRTATARVVARSSHVNEGRDSRRGGS
jgi:hypothetical protein